MYKTKTMIYYRIIINKQEEDDYPLSRIYFPDLDRQNPSSFSKYN